MQGTNLYIHRGTSKRFVTSTEVTKLVIHRGAVGREVNNQLSYRG